MRRILCFGFPFLKDISKPRSWSRKTSDGWDSGAISELLPVQQHEKQVLKCILIALFLFLLPQVGNGQEADLPRPLNCWSGYFATPIELPGDAYDRKIRSFKVVVNSWDEKGGRGELVIADGAVKFNEFGDGSADGRIGIQEHAVSLVHVKPELPKQRTARSSFKRKIYKLNFDESICDRDLFLNVPDDRSNPVRLLVCKVEKPKALQVGPVIESFYPLADLSKPIEHPEDEPTPDEATFSTSTLLLDGRIVSGITIGVNLNDVGTFLIDHNHCSINNYGDGGFQTAMGFTPIPTRFVSKDNVDPQNLGRRVFELELEPHPLLPKMKERAAVSITQYSIVLAAKSSGDHRLIIKREGKIVNVIPLKETGWRRHVANLSQIRNEQSRNVLRKLRGLCGNGLYFQVWKGDIALLRLGPKFSDDALSLVGELGEVTVLQLNEGGPEFSGTGLEAIGKLEKLESLTIGQSLATDRLLEIVGKLPRLRELRLNHRSDVSISDEGIAHLARSVNLERLVLRGSRITDKCMASLEDLNKLKSLELRGTEVTVAGVVAWRLKKPGCRISLMRYAKPTRIELQIPPEISHSDFVSSRGMHVDIKGKLTQSDYDAISQLKSIDSIALPESSNLENLKAILTIESLQTLIMVGNDNVKNEYVKEIAKLKGIRELQMQGCRNLDSECFQYLESMSKLERLSIASPGFDSQSLGELRKKLPKCKISFY